MAGLPRGGLYIRNGDGFFTVLRAFGESRDGNAQEDNKKAGGELRHFWKIKGWA
jgi:hypothetical protein